MVQRAEGAAGVARGAHGAVDAGAESGRVLSAQGTAGVAAPCCPFEVPRRTFLMIRFRFANATAACLMQRRTMVSSSSLVFARLLEGIRFLVTSQQVGQDVWFSDSHQNDGQYEGHDKELEWMKEEQCCIQSWSNIGKKMLDELLICACHCGNVNHM
jgi:hypothetical protein